MKEKLFFYTEDSEQHVLFDNSFFLPFLDLDNSSETGSKEWYIFLASVSQHDPNSKCKQYLFEGNFFN